MLKNIFAYVILVTVINMKIGIVCASDRCSRGESEDRSSPAIAEALGDLLSESEYRL